MEGGFADAPIDAAHTFRAALEALSRPGTVQRIAGAAAPDPMSGAAAGLILTLCDPDTPVWLAPSVDLKAIRDWIAFHTGAPLSDREDARFAIGTWDEMLPLSDFPIGSAEYPDRSATLIVEIPEMGEAHALTGPGIKRTARLTVPDVAAIRHNNALFPLGLDFFLTCGSLAAGLPRTTRVET